MTIPLNRLRYFHAIASAGSISAAARALNVAQPALSYHLSAMERELGSPLLHRTNRGVSLTHAGMVLYDRTEAIFRELDAVEDEIRQTHRVPRGRVNIALAATMARTIVPTLLRIVDREYPQLQLHIIDVPSVTAMEHIRDGRADLALAPNAAEMENCETIAAYTERLCFVVRSNGKRRRRQPCTFKELSRYALVLPRRNFDLRRRVEEAAIEAGVRLNIQYEQESPDIMRTIVMAGLAGSVTQEALFDPVSERPLVDIRPVEGPTVVRTHSIVRRLDRAKSIAVDAVAIALRRAMEDLTSEGVLPGRMVGSVNNV